MKTVLVVDDDPGVRKSFQLAFEDTPYKIEAAESGEAGLAKLADAAYDLIFLDLKMPGLNGVQTLREIRSRGILAPVYVVTAFYREFLSELEEAADDGLAFDVLEKPMAGDQLLAITNEILAGASA